MLYRQLTQDSAIWKACELAERVFMQYDAPDYTEEGIANFKAFISDSKNFEALTIHAAYCDNIIIGMIAFRKEDGHISMLFVDDAYHRQGVGTELVQIAFESCDTELITVNSSLYAVEFYESLDFQRISSDVRESDGMRFVPMIFNKNSDAVLVGFIPLEDLEEAGID